MKLFICFMLISLIVVLLIAGGVCFYFNPLKSLWRQPPPTTTTYTTAQFRGDFIKKINSELRKADNRIRTSIKRGCDEAVIHSLCALSAECKTINNIDDAGKNGCNISSIDLRISASLDTADKKNGIIIFQQVYTRNYNNELTLKKTKILNSNVNIVDYDSMYKCLEDFAKFAIIYGIWKILIGQ